MDPRRLLPAALLLVAAALPGAAGAAPGPGDRQACSAKHSVIANVPSGFVIGSCLAGTPERLAARSGKGQAGHNWLFGRIGGSFDGCGWIVDDQLAGRTTVASLRTCSTKAKKVDLLSFAALTNGGTASGRGCGVVDGRCQNGTPTDLKADCDLWANVRPFAAGQQPADLITHLTVANTPMVAWRYTTRRAVAGERYVMVKVKVDTADEQILASGDGNWGFVKRSCLRPGKLPGQITARQDVAARKAAA